MKLIVHNERGVALLTTLMLMVLGFGVVATLLYMVTYETKTTGLEQEYTIALDAAKGGADMIIYMMQNGIFSPPGLPGVSGPNSHSDCMGQKLTMATTDSHVLLNWPSCTANATGSDPRVDFDLTLTLASHRVYVKIIHTEVTDVNFFYSVNVRADASNGRDHAEISFLYQLAKPGS